MATRRIVAWLRSNQWQNVRGVWSILKSRFPVWYSEENRSNPSCGFTLVEILVTLAILSAVLPALLQIFTSTARNQALSDDNTTALYLLKFRMAEIEMNGYPDVGEATGDFGENSRYQWRSVVEDIASEQLQGVRRVQVTVSWQHLGKERSMAMSTFISDRQIQQTQTQQGGQPGSGPQ